MKKIIIALICIIICFSFITPCYASETEIIIPKNDNFFSSEVTIKQSFNNTIIIIPAQNNVIVTPSTTIEELNPIIYTDEETATETIIPQTRTINYDIFELVNQERIKNGLAALTYSAELQDAADLRAQEASVQFSHTRPDGSSCHSVIKGDYFVVGENLLMADPDYSLPSMMVETWMNSEGHRNNILLKHFTETAIGVYVSNNITFVAQLFKG